MMANKNKTNATDSLATTTTKSKQSKQQQISNDAKDYSSFKVVLFYCSLIVFLPVLTFFCLKAAVLDRFFNMTEIKSNIYSACGAVLSLHFALGLYIYRAYFSNGDDHTKSD